MDEYIETVDALAGELDWMAQTLGSLKHGEWSSPTLLIPVESTPNWTIQELAGHIGFAMNMVDTLFSQELETPPALDRVSFFDQPKGLIAPLAYRTARDTVATMSGAETLDYCLTGFSTAVVKAREADPAFVGWTVLGTIRTDEFIDTRIVEAVVHGLDLAQALDRAATPSELAVKRTAEVLDTLHRRQRNGTRPESLADDWLWVQVAAGRRRHDDFPTPLLS